MSAVSQAGHAAYREVEVWDGGSVTGRVTFSGDLPVDAVERISISKNPEVCGTGYREIVWVDVERGALRGTFVFIDRIKEGKPWPPPPGGGYMVDQKDCRFIPWAQVVRRGPITIRNSDKGVLHNINMREMIGIERGRPVKRTMFNFGQPDPGDIEKELKPRRSSFISLNCEAHNFMFGFMMAPEHPYAVVVNDDGTFAMANIPPGEYTVKAWHPKLGLRKTKVKVPAGGKVEANFEFTAK